MRISRRIAKANRGEGAGREREYFWDILGPRSSQSQRPSLSSSFEPLHRSHTTPSLSLLLCLLGTDAALKFNQD